MPTTARKTSWYSTGGPWGTGLLWLGVAVTAQGVGYATADSARLPRPLEVLTAIVPPWAWGLLWIAAGVWSIWQALTPPQRNLDVLPVVVVLSLWSAAYLVFWLIFGAAWGHWTREWSGALGWGMLAALIACWGRCVNPPTGARRR